MALGSNPKQNEVVKAVKDLEGKIGDIDTLLTALNSGAGV